MNFSVFEATAAWARNKKISLFAEKLTGSTNDQAKIEALSLQEESKLYIADQQSAGRGRGTNTWINPAKGAALLSTWSFRLNSPPQAISSPLIGLAVYTALQKTFGEKDLSIKAPNDIYLKDKKILGVLLETVKQGDDQRLLIGLGLNVFASPTAVDIAGYLSKAFAVDEAIWQNFLTNLYSCLRVAAQSIGEPALSEQARAELLAALNLHPKLSTPYTSISPFGDLATALGTRSWQDL